MEKVETQNLASHKGGVLISGVIICMINSAIPACETHGMKIWRVTTSNINWTVEDGRRKILRLYWGDDVEEERRGWKMRGGYRNAWICSSGSKKSLHNKIGKQEARRHLWCIKNEYGFVQTLRLPFLSRGKARSGFPKHLSCMPERTLPSPQKSRSAFPKSLSGMTGMSRPSHMWVYVADCQTYMRIAHKSRICLREPMPSAVGRSRGVEDGGNE